MLYTRIYSRYRRGLCGLLLLILLIGAATAYFGVYCKRYHTPAPEERSEPVRRPLCTCPLDRNLPIFVIETNGQDINAMPNRTQVAVYGAMMELWEASPRYRVTLRLYEPGEYGYTCVCGAAEPTHSQRVTISLRGQSTLSAGKKQYTLNLMDEQGNPEPLPLLGMPDGHQWVLNGSYMDKSLIRNALGFTLAGQIMEYAPRFAFCEVLLHMDDSPVTFDSDYIGVYLLVEKIERGPDRVDIKKADPRYNDISFILARDKVKANDDIYNTHWGMLEDEFIVGANSHVRQRSVIVGGYPGKSMTPQYRQRIVDYINAFEYALGSKKFEDPRLGYRRYIDVDSFIQMAMVNEVLKNVDGGEVSTYFYKDLGGKMKAGPVWDFDLTLGNSTILEMQDPTGIRITNVAWYFRLFQDEYFAAKYERAYRSLRKHEWTNANVEAIVDNLLNQLGPAAQRNSNRWYAGWDQQEVDDLKAFILVRMEWIDRNLHLVYRIRENAI